MSIIRDIYIVSISVLISVVMTLFLIPSSHIAVIDYEAILKEIVIQIQDATANYDEKKMLEEMKKYKDIKNILDIKIAQIAKQKNLIILPKDTAIGGYDLTNQAKDLLTDLIKEKSHDSK